MASFKLSKEWFDHVKNGTKIYEGRRWWNDDSLKKGTKHLKVGDILTFRHADDEKLSFEKTVKAIHLFSSFEEALTVLPLEKVLPGVSTVDEGVKIYARYVSLETQQKEGVCMIELWL